MNSELIIIFVHYRPLLHVRRNGFKNFKHKVKDEDKEDPFHTFPSEPKYGNVHLCGGSFFPKGMTLIFH